MKIVLVRHGQTTGNRDLTLTGWSDVLLTDKGREDLLYFKENYDYPKTQRYYTSDLTRTIQTFDILFGDQHEIYESREGFREVYFGDLEDELMEDYFQLFVDKWSLNERHYNWETVSEFTYRIISELEQVLRDLQKDGLESATIVCHSVVIRTLITFLSHSPYANSELLDTPNGLGYVLDLDYEDFKIHLNHYYEIKKK